jgi:putative membrane protein
MFHRYIKIVLAVLLIAFAVYQFTLGKIGNGIFLILLAAFPILFYFRNEFLLLAFLRLRKQDMEGTKKWLDKIKNPETALIKKQRGYYNYLYGLVFYQINLTQAEKYFRTALKYGLNMNYDEAMARLSIAGILMQKRRKREAQEFLSQAKKLDKQNLLKDQIRMMQKQMKKI